MTTHVHVSRVSCDDRVCLCVSHTSVTERSHTLTVTQWSQRRSGRQFLSAQCTQCEHTALASARKRVTCVFCIERGYLRHATCSRCSTRTLFLSAEDCAHTGLRWRCCCFNMGECESRNGNGMREWPTCNNDDTARSSQHTSPRRGGKASSLCATAAAAQAPGRQRTTANKPQR